MKFRDGKKAKKGYLRRPPRHEASTADANPVRVGRVEQGDARAGNSAARGGPQLELSRRQLKTWSKSEPLAALVPGPTFYYLYLFTFSRSRQESPSGLLFFVIFFYCLLWFLFSSLLGLVCVIRTVLFVPGTLLPGARDFFFLSSVVRLTLILV